MGRARGAGRAHALETGRIHRRHRPRGGTRECSGSPIPLVAPPFEHTSNDVWPQPRRRPRMIGMRNFKMIAALVLATGIATASALAGSESPRSGDLVVTKECSGFTSANNPP